MILNTITNDHYVYRWFYYLIHHPGVQAKLLKHDHVPLLYQRLKKRSLFLHAMHGLFILLFTLLFILKNWILCIPAALLVYPFVKIYRQKKIETQHISKFLLETELADALLKDQNLYQITEYFARQYKIPSLVDTMVRRDNIIRKTIVFTFIALIFILMPFHSWQHYIILLLSLYLSFQFTNTGLIYKKK